jgi:hypothetical protein
LCLPPAWDGSAAQFVGNRALASLGMIGVTAIPTAWMRKQDSAAP